MTENEDGPEPYLVPEKDANGRTIHRFAETEDSDTAGTPPELPDAEKAAAEKSQAMFRTTIATARAAPRTDWTKLSKMLDDMAPPRPSAADLLGALKAPAFRVPDLGLDEMAKAKRIEREREEQNSANIQTTAEVMKEMLSAMKTEAEQSAKRDKDAKVSAERNYRVAFWSMVLAAIAAVAAAAAVAPIVAPLIGALIEALKWWK